MNEADEVRQRDEMMRRLRLSFSASTASLMDDIDPAERREHNRRTMDQLRDQLLPARQP